MACESGQDLEDCHKQGKKILSELCKEFALIHQLDELTEASPKIKKKMRRLTALMIQADAYCKKHPHKKLVEKAHSVESDRLQYEMLRVCEEVEGAREILEMMQEEMLDKLDLYERKHKKKSSS